MHRQSSLSVSAHAFARVAALIVLIVALGASGAAAADALLAHATVRLDPEASATRTAIRTAGASVTPFMSDAFADSFGVNTRFGTGIYAQQRDVVKADLLELGFRHIRDGNVTDNAQVRSFLRELCTQNGIHSALGLSDRDSDDQIVQYGRDLSGCLDMVEGPNELNGQPNWAQRLTTFMPHVYRLVHGSPVFAGVPVVGPSITKLEDSETLEQMEDLSKFIDIGNKHSYPGQRNIGGDDGTGAKGWGPTHAACPKYGYGSFFFSICAAQLVSKDRVVWTTETGYASTPDGLASLPTHPPWASIPYEVAVKYFPRLMAYEFLNGIPRTYIMALVDGASGCKGPFNSLGLIEQDCPNTGAASSLHTKPQFYALKHLMETVADPGPAFTTTPLTLRVSGADPKLQTLLLQKRSGRYLLLYWVEGSDWNVTPGTYAQVEPEHVVVSIHGAGAPVRAQIFGFDGSGNLTRPAAATFTNGSVPLTATDTIGFLTFDIAGR